MARLTDVDALSSAMCERCNFECGDEPCEPSECYIRNTILRSPTVDAVPVVHGRWNWISDCVVSCSNCERDFYPEDDVNAGVAWYYCPKCGAKMDLEVE